MLGSYENAEQISVPLYLVFHLLPYDWDTQVLELDVSFVDYSIRSWFPAREQDQLFSSFWS